MGALDRWMTDLTDLGRDVHGLVGLQGAGQEVLDTLVQAVREHLLG